ncbi:MAG: hypothetical protein AAF719_08635 [Pseudomonadota bacterium]
MRQTLLTASFAAATAMFGGLGLAQEPTIAPPPLQNVSFSLQPDVECQDGVCEIHLKGYAEGTTVSTAEALVYPYIVLLDAEPYEPRPIPPERLSDRLPGSYGFTFGYAERETEVFIEPLASLGRLNVFAVEQQAGVENIRQVHYLFWVDETGVSPIFQRVDGPGPVASQLELTEEGLIYQRRFYPDDELGHMNTREEFVWIVSGDEEKLAPRSQYEAQKY